MEETNEAQKNNWIEEMIIRESIPKAAREETTTNFLKRTGVKESTYYWQASRPENQKKILAITLSNAKKETPEVLAKLGENAKEGKEKSIEMYLKFVLELAEKNIVQVDSISTILNDIDKSTKEEPQE